MPDEVRSPIKHHLVLHRKPIKYVFGAEYGPLFIAANKRARLARGGDRRARRS